MRHEGRLGRLRLGLVAATVFAAAVALAACGSKSSTSKPAGTTVASPTTTAATTTTPAGQKLTPTARLNLELLKVRRRRRSLRASGLPDAGGGAQLRLTGAPRRGSDRHHERRCTGRLSRVQEPQHALADLAAYPPNSGPNKIVPGTQRACRSRPTSCAHAETATRPLRGVRGGPVIVNTWAYGKKSNEQAFRASCWRMPTGLSVDSQRRGQQRVERASDRRAGRAPRLRAPAEAVAAAQETALTGPALIAPAKQARFTAAGFRPGSNVEVVLVPADGMRCCGMRIASTFRVLASGKAVLGFLVPTYYKRCGAWSMNARRLAPQRAGGRDRSGYLAQARTTTAIGPFAELLALDDGEALRLVAGRDPRPDRQVDRRRRAARRSTGRTSSSPPRGAAACRSRSREERAETPSRVGPGRRQRLDHAARPRDADDGAFVDRARVGRRRRKSERRAG